MSTTDLRRMIETRGGQLVTVECDDGVNTWIDIAGESGAAIKLDATSLKAMIDALNDAWDVVVGDGIM